MNTLIAFSHELHHLTGLLPGADPIPPGTGGTLPAGVADKVNNLLYVLRWVGGVVAMIGLVMVGMSWMISHRRAAGGEKAGPLGWWAAGALLVGAAASIAGWML